MPIFSAYMSKKQLDEAVTYVKSLERRLVKAEGEALRARTTLEDIQRWIERGELAKAGPITGGEILARKCRYALTGDGGQEKSDA